MPFGKHLLVGLCLSNGWCACDGTPPKCEVWPGQAGFHLGKDPCMKGSPTSGLFHLLSTEPAGVWWVLFVLPSVAGLSHTTLLNSDVLSFALCPTCPSSGVLLLTGTFPRIKFFVAISPLNPRRGRKPAHAFVLASFVRHGKFHNDCLWDSQLMGK